MRQARNYGALNEAHRQVEQEQNSQPEAPSQAASRQPRSYGAVQQTQWQLDGRQNPSNTPERPPIVRSWTHYGGMVPQQDSANEWIKQNREIRMSDSGKSGAGRGGEGTSSPSGQQQNNPELQQARAAVEEARRREAAERARQQERERGGPER